MTKPVTGSDYTLLLQVAAAPANFRYEPWRKSVKLVTRNYPEEAKERMHALALRGLLAEKVDGDCARGEIPHTTYIFTITALGRDAIRRYAPAKEAVA